MAATPKKAQKVKLDYNIDKKIYDDFVRNSSKKGYAPNVLVERLIKKFNETGQLWIINRYPTQMRTFLNQNKNIPIIHHKQE